MDKKELEEEIGLNIQYDKNGLVPVIAQDYTSGEILMLAYANPEALEETIRTGYAFFWSRSRNELWKKGETSGDLLKVGEILVDCDQDALIYRAEMLGDGVCHTKNKIGESRMTCFYRRIGNRHLEFIEGLE